MEQLDLGQAGLPCPLRDLFGPLGAEHFRGVDELQVALVANVEALPQDAPAAEGRHGLQQPADDVPVDLFESGNLGIGASFVRSLVGSFDVNTHKIVIGQGGSVLRQVGSATRAQLPPGAYLELFDKVDRDWQSRPHALERLGY